MFLVPINGYFIIFIFKIYNTSVIVYLSNSRFITNLVIIDLPALNKEGIISHVMADGKIKYKLSKDAYKLMPALTTLPTQWHLCSSIYVSFSETDSSLHKLFSVSIIIALQEVSLHSFLYLNDPLHCFHSYQF